MISYCLVSSLFTPRVRILRRGRVHVFGRDRNADFPIPSEVVSRRHAELAWSPRGGAFEVRDCGSKNGTRVNEVPLLEPRILKDGETVTIGPFAFQYREYQGDISSLISETDNDPDLESTAALDRDALLAQARAVKAGAGPGGAIGGAGFAGNFSGQELLEIVRLVAMGEKDGVLTIISDHLSGQIGFLKGEIRHAIAGERAGEEAVFALLGLERGRFEFTASAMTLEKNCRVRTEAVAMEVARRMDESAQGAAAPPAPSPQPAAAQPPAATAPPKLATAPGRAPGLAPSAQSLSTEKIVVQTFDMGSTDLDMDPKEVARRQADLDLTRRREAPPPAPASPPQLPPTPGPP